MFVLLLSNLLKNIFIFINIEEVSIDVNSMDFKVKLFRLNLGLIVYKLLL